MKHLKRIYKIIRGVLFSSILLVGVTYTLLYILLSMPVVQNKIKIEAEKELSGFLSSKIKIESVDIRPFNEVMVNGLQVYDKSGKKCIEVDNVGAGIRLWRLIRDGRIELSFAEIIGLEAKISQQEKDAPLNIQFLIDAFSSKDKSKPPTKFDLNLRNVVLRKCGITFDKEWIPLKPDYESTDFNHLRLSGLNADLNIPKLSNDIYSIDVRRLSFMLSGGLEVKTLAFKTKITPESLSLTDLCIKLPNSEIRPSDLFLKFDGFKNIMKSLSDATHNFIMIDNSVTPSDFSWLIPELSRFPYTCYLSLDVSGNMRQAELKNLSVVTEEKLMTLEMSGSASRIYDKDSVKFNIDNFELEVTKEAVDEVARLIPNLNNGLKEIIGNIGNSVVTASGSGFPAKGKYDLDCDLKTKLGGLGLTARTQELKKGGGKVNGELILDDIDIGTLTKYAKAGTLSSDVVFEVNLNGKDFDGKGSLNVTEFIFDGKEVGGITADVEKTGKEMRLSASMENGYMDCSLTGQVSEDGYDSRIDLEMMLARLDPELIGVGKKYPGYIISGNLSSHLIGNNVDNMIGTIDLTDFNFRDEVVDTDSKSFGFKNLSVRLSEMDSDRHIRVFGDWIDGDIAGQFKIKDIPGFVGNLAHKVFPSVVMPVTNPSGDEMRLDFTFNLKPDNTVTEFFNLPFRLLVDIPVTGSLDGPANSASFNIDIPYLQQGRDKLMKSTRIEFQLEGESGTANAGITSTFPAKKGEMTMDLHVFAEDDNVFSDIIWETPSNHALDGKISLDALVRRDELSGKPEFSLDISPSTFDFGNARWNINKSNITYDDGALEIKGLRIWHDKQFVDIEGRASSSEEDKMAIKLADIDIGYIFETLNINYVTFGGNATGEITALGALGSEPVAQTQKLDVKQFSYNGIALGDAILKSAWDNNEKQVRISADITSDENRKTTIDGGIWVTRDSLSFTLDADRVPVGIIAPFMSAFSSDVKGRASGQATLYGTFSDIDLIGKLHADEISLKLNVTNVAYNGSDSVYLYPGRIVIPSFRLYDRDGNSAVLSGELKHRYFHDPEFNFKVTNARNLLCFDTNSKINPDWYGTIYGNGSATVKGVPGLVGVSVDMTATGASTFTFVLNDAQAAEDYHFLTFSDKRKEEAERLVADSVPSVLAAFQKKMIKSEDKPSKYIIDIRGSITPSTLMTLVMDPVAGDKITARGSGNVQMDYDSESEDIQMFGKYYLEDGNYNFSLQDLILRDFKIRRGSSISFNGDPYNAQLNIVASYRVNTNLTDLDKSFATDRELARTNVPVDALLMVEGDMQHPDISFDVELPTLTKDVERKVKSIISTDDMMSRQIIYLLALNRFYTPEYMGSTSNGGELASVASSTLSSQLSNMLGQLTDKFTVAPSFRSDKGDFSDIEVDVALSSRLLNNRLLVNGNFGYRDRNTSTTTFVGDFDVEYILSRNGSLRLKAYNHFNDQNYYLRQALTTQGLGVIYRKDFENIFKFLHRRKDSGKSEQKEKNDTVSADKRPDAEKLTEIP